MDELAILGAGFFLILGFLIGWIAEWRIDVAYWSVHRAELYRRERVSRSNARRNGARDQQPGTPRHK